MIAALLRFHGLGGEAEVDEARREFDQIALGLLDVAPRPDSIRITYAGIVWRFERATDVVLLAAVRPGAIAVTRDRRVPPDADPDA